MYVCIYVYMYICIYVNMYICMNVYACVSFFLHFFSACIFSRLFSVVEHGADQQVKKHLPSGNCFQSSTSVAACLLNVSDPAYVLYWSWHAYTYMCIHIQMYVYKWTVTLQVKAHVVQTALMEVCFV